MEKTKLIKIFLAVFSLVILIAACIPKKDINKFDNAQEQKIETATNLETKDNLSDMVN